MSKDNYSLKKVYKSVFKLTKESHQSYIIKEFDASSITNSKTLKDLYGKYNISAGNYNIINQTISTEIPGLGKFDLTPVQIGLIGCIDQYYYGNKQIALNTVNILKTGQITESNKGKDKKNFKQNAKYAKEFLDECIKNNILENNYNIKNETSINNKKYMIAKSSGYLFELFLCYNVKNFFGEEKVNDKAIKRLSVHQTVKYISTILSVIYNMINYQDIDNMFNKINCYSLYQEIFPKELNIFDKLIDPTIKRENLFFDFQQGGKPLDIHVREKNINGKVLSVLDLKSSLNNKISENISSSATAVNSQITKIFEEKNSSGELKNNSDFTVGVLDILYEHSIKGIKINKTLCRFISYADRFESQYQKCLDNKSGVFKFYANDDFLTLESENKYAISYSSQKIDPEEKLKENIHKFAKFFKTRITDSEYATKKAWKTKNNFMNNIAKYFFDNNFKPSNDILEKIFIDLSNDDDLIHEREKLNWIKEKFDIIKKYNNIDKEIDEAESVFLKNIEDLEVSHLANDLFILETKCFVQDFLNKKIREIQKTRGSLSLSQHMKALEAYISYSSKSPKDEERQKANINIISYYIEQIKSIIGQQKFKQLNAKYRFLSSGDRAVFDEFESNESGFDEFESKSLETLASSGLENITNVSLINYNQDVVNYIKKYNKNMIKSITSFRSFFNSDSLDFVKRQLVEHDSSGSKSTETDSIFLQLSKSIKNNEISKETALSVYDFFMNNIINENKGNKNYVYAHILKHCLNKKNILNDYQVIVGYNLDYIIAANLFTRVARSIYDDNGYMKYKNSLDKNINKIYIGNSQATIDKKHINFNTVLKIYKTFNHEKKLLYKFTVAYLENLIDPNSKTWMSLVGDLKDTNNLCNNLKEIWLTGIEEGLASITIRNRMKSYLNRNNISIDRYPELIMAFAKRGDSIDLEIAKRLENSWGNATLKKFNIDYFIYALTKNLKEYQSFDKARGIWRKFTKHFNTPRFHNKKSFTIEEKNLIKDAINSLNINKDVKNRVLNNSVFKIHETTFVNKKYLIREVYKHLF